MDTTTDRAARLELAVRLTVGEPACIRRLEQLALAWVERRAVGLVELPQRGIGTFPSMAGRGIHLCLRDDLLPWTSERRRT